MLGDKNVFFPNLPDELRAGIPAETPPLDKTYWMMTAERVYTYETMARKTTSSLSLADFLGCGDALGKKRD